MNHQVHQGHQESNKDNREGSKQSFLVTLVFLVVNLSLPLWVEACPRCLAASPYKTGLLWAVLLLLPVPFILAGLLVRWVVRHSKPEFPPV